MPDSLWEKAVVWLREQPDQQRLVRDCYYDDPLLDAARRFTRSNEWQSTRRFFPSRPGVSLDLGAGRGISSFAIASENWQVVALEPDPGELVGSRAISGLARESALPITVVRGFAENLPFVDGAFDVVYGREVLHHARDLRLLCREVYRVLKLGGRFIAAREHVISKPSDLESFREAHPLHRLYGGENAFPLREYASSITESGLRLRAVIGPHNDAMNYFPITDDEWREACIKPLARFIGEPGKRFLLRKRNALGRMLIPLLARLRTRLSQAPGRLYSFVADKR